MFLNCHTYYSFKYGTLREEELFDEAKINNINKLVLTEINNTSSWVELRRICEERKEEHHLEIIPGIEFRRDNKLLYIGIAKDGRGFAELNSFLSWHNCEKIPLPATAPEFSNAFIIFPFNKVPSKTLNANEYIGIRGKELNKLYTSTIKDRHDKLVILHPVTFKGKVGFNLHRLLRAVDRNTLLSKLTIDDVCENDEFMVKEDELQQRFKHFPHIIKNTQRLIDSCTFEATLHESKNKKNFFDEKGKSDHGELRKLAFEGIRKRYGTHCKAAEERVETELSIIANQHFEAYFLITHDIVRFATHKNFAHVGRGSGANSIVSYCLGLTDVDPIELDLYFERFLNPHRSSPPDFDIDFSWKNRNEVIDYILKKYDRGRSALLGSFMTFQLSATIRELGKVFGLPKSEIDELVSHPTKHKDRDPIAKLIFSYGSLLKDFPKNQSIHAGGIIISEEPLYRYTALDMPPKEFQTTQFDMYSAEDLGYYKYDILSQRGLGHIKDSIELVKKNQEKDIDINAFSSFKADNNINDLLKSGKTMGCFYVESPAMRGLLAKLQCDNYATLVAASSIIRPGVASSGMMREYIFRHHNPDKFNYIHPLLEKLMSETYGVMVYQEDVIKVAHHYAGITLAEADILRRGMSGKSRHRKEFELVREKFFSKAKENSRPEEITKELWRQIESFSGYSFSKAHSASYAVESYQSLYLKTYYPLEFLVGVINNFGGFYKTEFYIHEARKSGGNVLPPCVNKSAQLTTIEGKDIYLGFIHLKNLEQKVTDALLAEREKDGPYLDLYNFIKRVPVGIEQITVLIRIGAFRFTGKSKRTLLWEAFGYLGKGKPKHSHAELFSVPVKQFEMPVLERKPLEDAFDEIEILEFPLCNPFDLLDSKNKLPLKAIDLLSMANQTVEIVGYLVATKDIRSKTGAPMQFGTFLDTYGDFFDSVHFPQIAKQFPFLGKGFYKIKGTVVLDFGYPIIEAIHMKKIPMVTQ